LKAVKGSIATEETYPSARHFVTKDELAYELNLPSARMVDEFIARQMIPYYRLGHRTLRFVLDEVIEALKKFRVLPVC